YGRGSIVGQSRKETHPFFAHDRSFVWGNKLAQTCKQLQIVLPPSANIAGKGQLAAVHPKTRLDFFHVDSLATSGQLRNDKTVFSPLMFRIEPANFSQPFGIKQSARQVPRGFAGKPSAEEFVHWEAGSLVSGFPQHLAAIVNHPYPGPYEAGFSAVLGRLEA